MNQQTITDVSAQINHANNVLVAVNSSPSVDELSAAIGLTLVLNKLGKHATTVFSGEVPSNLEFLQPEQAIEKSTDSLRDFIIALDKAKADKLRYKVEDEFVRIFITPYKTTLSEHDLQFTHGDFNVDCVVSIGVSSRENIDRAVTAHGQILHDAQVIALNDKQKSASFGNINWSEPQASSLCEMVAAIVDKIAPNQLDGQMATALLTGIIAETDRFRNQSTTPQTFELSSKLMSAGANQQLIADKLEAPAQPAQPAANNLSLDSSVQSQSADTEATPAADGSLSISHENDSAAASAASQPKDQPVDNINIDNSGNVSGPTVPEASSASSTEQDEPKKSTYLPPEPPKPSEQDMTKPDPVYGSGPAPIPASEPPKPLAETQETPSKIVKNEVEQKSSSFLSGPPSSSNNSEGILGEHKVIDPISKAQESSANQFTDNDPVRPSLGQVSPEGGSSSQSATTPVPKPIAKPIPTPIPTPESTAVSKPIAPLAPSSSAKPPKPPSSAIPVPLQEDSAPKPESPSAVSSLPNIIAPSDSTAGSSNVDLSKIPKPLTESAASAPPPVPPPMTPSR